MSYVTPSDLALLRAEPQEIELKLAIYQPQTVMACQINGTVSKGSRTIPYGSVTTGSYTNVDADFTMLVGSALGLSDIGKIRIRSVDASNFTVAENSNIQWANGQYLTVLKYVDIVPIYPRMIQDPSNPDNVIFYKDYDIPYSNQNFIGGTFINMGSHRAVEIITGCASIYYDATGSSHVDGDTLSYLWNFGGASGPTGSTSMTPGLVNYTTPGNYVTKLTTTSSQGAVDVSYRYINVLPQGGQGIQWRLVSMVGSRSAGGYTAKVMIYSQLPFTLYDGTVVVIYTNETYAGNNKAIGGNQSNNLNTFFVGHVMGDTIRYNYMNSTIEFEVSSVTEVMKAAEAFSVSIEDAIVPSTWYQIKGLNTKKAIYHYLRWHSTVLKVCDFSYLGNDNLIQYFDTSRESLYDAINNVIKKAIVGEIVCDRLGEVYAEVAMQAVHLAKSTYPPQFSVGAADWIDEPNTKEVMNTPLSYLEMGGIVYSGNPSLASSAGSTALLAAAPGVSPHVRGKASAPDGLALQSQTQLNNLVGDIFAYTNARYPEITMKLGGAYKNLDIAPQEAQLIYIDPTTTSRNVSISGTYFVQELSYDAKSDYNSLLVTAKWRAITEGVAGDAIAVPVPPTQGYNAPSFNVPAIPSLSFPSLNFPGIVNPPTAPVVSGLLGVLCGGQFYYTFSLIPTGTVWSSGSYTSMPTGNMANMLYMDMDFYGNVYMADNIRVWGGTYNQPKALIADATYFNAQIGAGYLIKGLGVNPNIAQTCCVYAGIGYPTNVGYLFVGGTSLTRKNAVPGPELYGNITHDSYGNWMLSYSSTVFQVPRYLIVEDVNYTTLVDYSFGTSSNYINHVRAGITGDKVVITYAPAKSVTNKGNTQSDLGINLENVASSLIQQVGIDPSGQYMLAQPATSTVIKKSTDGGVTWSNLTTFPVTPQIRSCVILNLNSQSQFLVYCVDNNTSAKRLFYTSDFGVTWSDVMGNLQSLVVNNIQVMRYSP